MVKMLLRHGANLEYVDHALRNALYWSVYNCCGEITVFLLDCGAQARIMKRGTESIFNKNFPVNFKIILNIRFLIKTDPELQLFSKLSQKSVELRPGS